MVRVSGSVSEVSALQPVNAAPAIIVTPDGTLTVRTVSKPPMYETTLVDWMSNRAVVAAGCCVGRAVVAAGCCVVGKGGTVFHSSKRRSAGSNIDCVDASTGPMKLVNMASDILSRPWHHFLAVDL